jgi:hypothetical protein
MQATGAEMLRLALTLACERGIMVCAPVHDAILIEAPDEEIESEAARLQEAMLDASEAILRRRIRVGEPTIVRSGQRYVDKRGAKLYEEICEELEKMLLEEGLEQQAYGMEVGCINRGVSRVQK